MVGSFLMNFWPGGQTSVVLHYFSPGMKKGSCIIKQMGRKCKLGEKREVENHLFRTEGWTHSADKGSQVSKGKLKSQLYPFSLPFSSGFLMPHIVKSVLPVCSFYPTFLLSIFIQNFLWRLSRRVTKVSLNSGFKESHLSSLIHILLL